MPSLSLSLWNRHHPQTYFQQDKKKPKTQSLTDPKLDGVSESKALDLLEPQAMPAAYNNSTRISTQEALRKEINKYHFQRTCFSIYHE